MPGESRAILKKKNMGLPHYDAEIQILFGGALIWDFRTASKHTFDEIFHSITPKEDVREIEPLDNEVSKM